MYIHVRLNKMFNFPITYNICQCFANHNAHIFIKQHKLEISLFALIKIPTQIG